MNKLYALILLLCISCSNRQKEVAVPIENETDSIQSEVLGQASEPFFQIDLFKEMKKAQKGQLKLSDFFQSIEYVPLETTDKSLIGGGKRLKGFTVSSKVIIDDMKLFDRKDGHFIGNVMNQGQGPQEYLFMFSIAVDDEREECYVYDSGKGVIHIVGYDTMYKKSIPCKSDVKLISAGKGNLLIARSASLKGGYDDYYVLNIDSEEIIAKRRSSAFTNLKSIEDCRHIKSDQFKTLALGENVFWKYKNEIRYYDYLTDSIYSINEHFKVTPIGYINCEDLKITKEQFKVGFLSRDFLTWSITGIMETDNELIVRYRSVITKPTSKVTSYELLYSKKDANSMSFQCDDGIFINDLDGGLAVSPYSQVYGENGLCSYWSAEKIKDHKINTGKSSVFKSMANKLRYDDNEVVGILKWK